ncbi:hypothetical protein QZH41_019938, partial [Actinostola sp. cb2023]
SPEKVRAIVDAPVPTCISELRSFLGMLQYYGKFLANLSTMLQPLNNLLRERVPWLWKPECQQAFNGAKEQLLSSKVLTHYDVNLPLVLACDASSYGIGAVISHVMENGEERPIAFASRTLSSSEKNYGQIEKEALSLVYGVKKFHQYLYGRKFIMETDHKPLLTILGPKNTVPTLAAARLQRWALILSSYQYDVKFRNTEAHANADALSRLPVDHAETSQESEIFHFNYVNDLTELPETFRMLHERIRSCHECCSLSKMDGLTSLHEDHPGICRMKALARSYLWWPKLGSAIEEMVLYAHSKWPEVFATSSTTATITIDLLSVLFAAYGLPEELVSDNGPQFTSEEFGNFMKRNGITHTRTPPYHPASNGPAERYVQTLKHALKTSQVDKGQTTQQQRLSSFLFSYRNTPHTVTDQTPAELFLKRKPRTRLSLLQPNLAQHVEEKQQVEKEQHDQGRTKTREFVPGDHVLVRNFRGKNKWNHGTVILRIGPLAYQVKVGDRMCHAHVDHLLPAGEQVSGCPTDNLAVEEVTVSPFQNPFPLPSHLATSGSTCEETSLSVPTRESQEQERPAVVPVSAATTPERRYPKRRIKSPERLNL